MSSIKTARILVLISIALIGASSSALAQPLSPSQQLAGEIYQDLVEINTVTPTGDTGKAAGAMAARLRGRGARELFNRTPPGHPRRHLYAHLLRGRFNSEESK